MSLSAGMFRRLHREQRTKNHLKDRKTETDRQIDHDLATLLSFGNSHSSH